MRNMVFETGSVTSTTSTLQSILSYTVPPNQIFNLQHFDCAVRLSSYSTVNEYFGQMLMWQGLTNIYIQMMAGAGMFIISKIFDEPLQFAAGQEVSILCWPSISTSSIWTANLTGFNYQASWATT